MSGRDDKEQIPAAQTVANVPTALDNVETTESLAAQSTTDDAQTRNMVSAVLHPKAPPAESLHSVRVRRLVVGSFWTVVLLLGLPLWWYTTTVYRAELPVADMQAWATGQVHDGRLF